jgi:flagellar motor switch protein FliM
MSDVLSQKEIDALLRNISQGEEIEDSLSKEDEITKYDFRRPYKFSRDHIRTFEIIHDNFAKAVAPLLTRHLRTSFQLEVVSIEALSFVDFNRSITNPSIIAITEMAPLKGSIVLNMPPSIAYAMVDRLLGGTRSEVAYSNTFTTIELSTINGMLKQVVAQLQEPWENVIQLNPFIERVETDPEFSQIASPNEMIMLITFQASIDRVEDFITLCYPHMVIEPIMSRLNARLWYGSDDKKATTHDNREIVADIINRTHVDLEVVLGNTDVSYRDVLNLEEGDIIKLDSKVDEKLPIYIDKFLKFFGSPGTLEGFNAVQIDGLYRGSDDNEDV